MEENITDLVQEAAEAFENKRYELCTRILLRALQLIDAENPDDDAEEDKNARLSSALHAQMGHCFMAMTDYDSAAFVFHQAQEYLRLMSRFHPQDMEHLQRYTAEAAASTISKASLSELQSRINDLFAAGSPEEADELCQTAHDEAVARVGERNWYAAMVKVLQASCKIDLCKTAPGSQVDSLLEQAAQLYATAREICAAGRNEVWVNLIDERAADLQSFIEERRQRPDAGELDSDGFLPAPDWTPDSDREEAQRERRQQQRRKPAILRNWAQPFRGMNFTLLKAEWQQALEPADQLFTRHEYALCFPELEEVMRLADAHNDSLLGCLVEVMAARCNRGLGDYEGAVRFLTMSMDWLKSVREVGPRMRHQLQELLERVRSDEALQQRLNTEIEPLLTRLCAKGQFDDAADTCDVHLHRTQKELGADHWFCNVALALKAKVLVARAKTSTKEESAPLLDEADELLDKASEGVDAHGHDVYWVKSVLIAPVREQVYDLRP